MNEIKVIQKTLKNREELKSVVLEIYKETPNVTFLVSTEKEIPGSEDNWLTLNESPWKDIAVLTMYRDAKEDKCYSFAVPNIPGSEIYVFDFE